MDIKYTTPYETFMLALDTFNMSTGQLEKCLDIVKEKALPEKLKFDFYALSFGKFATLQRIKTGYQFLTQTFAIILLPDELAADCIDGLSGKGLTRLLKGYRLNRFHKRVLNLDTMSALRFVYEVKTKFEEAIKLFEELKYEPDEDERKAGIETTGGDLFGVADYYAKRMGITNHEDVFKLPWTRIYAVMKLDVKDNQFRRRLQQVKEEKSNDKNKKK